MTTRFMLHILLLLLAQFSFSEIALAQVFPSKPRPNSGTSPKPKAEPILSRSFDVVSLAWEEGLTVRGCYVGGVYTNDPSGRARGGIVIKGPDGKSKHTGQPCLQQKEAEYEIKTPPEAMPQSGLYILYNDTFPNKSPIEINFDFSGNAISGYYFFERQSIYGKRKIERTSYYIDGKRTQCVGFLKGTCYYTIMKSGYDTWIQIFGFYRNSDGTWSARGAQWNRYDAGAGFSRFRMASNDGANAKQPDVDGINPAISQTLPLSSLNAFDTYVRSSVPQALWGTEPTILVGGWGDEYRGLIRFEIDSLPKMTSGSSVKLRLYAKSPTDGTEFRPTSMAIYRASSPFSGTTSWQNQPSVDRGSDQLVEVEREGWIEIDITSYIEIWQAGSPNHGIVLMPTSTANKFNMFVSGNDGARQQFWPALLIKE